MTKRKLPPGENKKDKKYNNTISCPWWYNKSDGHQNNIYGLYEFIQWSTGHEELRTEIDLSFWPINDYDIMHLMGMMSEKMMSSLTSLERKEHSMKGGTKANLSNHLKHIQKLKFHSCIHLTDMGIDFLAKNWNFRGREILSIDTYLCHEVESNHNTITNANASTVTATTKDKRENPSNSQQKVSSISASCISLQYLNLPLLHLDVSNCSIGNHACKVIGENFTKLQVLNLSDCIKISDEGIISIMKGCKYLHEIHLKNLVQLQDTGLRYVRQNLVMMKLLRIIDIDGCIGFTNEAIIHLLESDTAGTIYQINMSNCKQIQLGMMGFCRHPTSNSVKSIELRNIPNLTDSIMGWVASGCKNLQKIDLSRCQIMHEVTLGYLFEGCKRLKVIKLNGCHGLNDNSLTAIDQEIGKSLEELGMIGCKKLTNNSIIRIASLCPNLKKLNLRGAPIISDDALKALAKSCPLLEFLDFSRQMCSSQPSTDSQTPRVGSDGVAALGRSCRYLHTFFVMVARVLMMKV